MSDKTYKPPRGTPMHTTSSSLFRQRSSNGSVPGGIGAALTAEQELELYNLMRAYMRDRGWRFVGEEEDIARAALPKETT